MELFFLMEVTIWTPYSDPDPRAGSDTIVLSQVSTFSKSAATQSNVFAKISYLSPNPLYVGVSGRPLNGL